MMEGVLSSQFATGKLAVPQGVINIRLSVWLIMPTTWVLCMVKLSLSLCITFLPDTWFTCSGRIEQAMG